jgi:hypothetical protein
MTLLEQAVAFVRSWNEPYDFAGLCEWTAGQPGGHVVIRPDFIGIAQEDGDTINIWLAMGPDGVRKAIDLAPDSAKFAAWKRGARNKDDKPRIWEIDRIRRKLNERRIPKSGKDAQAELCVGLCKEPGEEPHINEGGPSAASPVSASVACQKAIQHSFSNE